MKVIKYLFLSIMCLALFIGFASPIAADSDFHMLTTLNSIGCSSSSTYFSRVGYIPGETRYYSTIVSSGGQIYMDEYFEGVNIDFLNSAGIWALYNSNDRGLQSASFPIPAAQPISIYVDLYNSDGNLIFRTYIELDNCDGGSITEQTWYSYEQLIENGTFETAGATAAIAKYWTPKNLDNDKRVCNKDKTGDGDTDDPEDKIVAFSGQCAFLLRGTLGVSSQIQQTWKIPLGSGNDFVILGARAEAKNVIGARFITRFRYADNTKGKAKINFTPGTYAYTPFNTALITGGPIENIKTSLIMSGTGKITLDNVSSSLMEYYSNGEAAALEQAGTAYMNLDVSKFNQTRNLNPGPNAGGSAALTSSTLDLPAAPEGFRK